MIFLGNTRLFLLESRGTLMDIIIWKIIVSLMLMFFNISFNKRILKVCIRLG